MNLDYFYIIGILFIPMILFLALRKKETVLNEQAETEQFLKNPFEIISFIKKKFDKIILSVLFYLWLAFGIISSEQRNLFIAFTTYLFVSSYFIYIASGKNARYWIETSNYIIGALILSAIIYRHFYFL